MKKKSTKEAWRAFWWAVAKMHFKHAWPIWGFVLLHWILLRLAWGYGTWWTLLLNFLIVETLILYQDGVAVYRILTDKDKKK